MLAVEGEKAMDIIEFFKKRTGLVPTPQQEQFLLALTNLDIKKLLASCGRQTGKSLCTAVAVLWWVFEYPDPIDILLMSTMDSYVYDHIENIFAKNSDLVVEVVVEGVSGLVPLRGFQTKKGSRVHVRGSTNKQIRGLGVNIVIIDEAAEIADEMITTALGNLHSPIEKFVMLSTPHKNSIFTTIAINPDKYGFILFTWDAENVSWQSKTLIASKKAMMSPQEYKVEVLGIPLSTEERQYFPAADIKLCVKEHVDRENVPNSRIEAGIDWGESIGETVVTVTERIYARRKILFIKRYRKAALELILPEIKEILDKFKPETVRCDSKPTYAVDLAKKQLKYLKVVDFQFHKAEMLAQLLRKIKTHSLEIGDNQVDLIKQLRSYRLHKRAGDDLIDSLILAIYETDSSQSGKTNIIK